MIALVRRPRRKMHLAGLQDGAWWSVCDRVVLEQDGTTAIALDAAIGMIDDHADDVCRDCHRLILMAAFAGRDRVARLLASMALTA